MGNGQGVNPKRPILWMTGSSYTVYTVKEMEPFEAVPWGNNKVSDSAWNLFRLLYAFNVISRESARRVEHNVHHFDRLLESIKRRKLWGQVEKQLAKGPKQKTYNPLDKFNKTLKGKAYSKGRR